MTIASLIPTLTMKTGNFRVGLDTTNTADEIANRVEMSRSTDGDSGPSAIACIKTTNEVANCQYW